MPEIGLDFEQVAEEYSDISDSVRSLHKNMGGFIETIESDVVGTGIEGAEDTVESYSEFERALQQFDTEITYLMEILRGNTTPDSLEEFDDIETACDRLCFAAEQFQSDCLRLAQSFSQAGATDAAENLQTLAVNFGTINTSINESFFDNQLLTSLKAYYFPNSIVENIPEIVEALDAENLERRQNSYGMLMMAAKEKPVAVAPYADQIADNLTTASPGEQQNLLGTLNVLQSEGETLGRDVRSDALDLVDAADPTVALYASLLLAREATTAEQAQIITTRIESLLTKDIETEEWANATFVLYELARSHPDAVEHVTQR